MLSFLEHQFVSFRKHTMEPDFQEKFYNFPDGEERLVLNTPNPDICFSFTEDEWTNFAIAMEEAAYMQSIYKLVHC